MWREIIGFENYEVSKDGQIRKKYANGKVLILKQKIGNTGYKMVMLWNQSKPKNVYVHRIVADAFVTKQEGEKYVDHINGNILDNQSANLRWCTNKQNCSNHKISLRNKSGMSGVGFCKKRKQWRARIFSDGKEKHLGYFTSKEAAGKARQEAEKKYFGDFVRK